MTTIYPASHAWIVALLWTTGSLIPSNALACAHKISRKHVDRADLLLTEDVGVLSEEDLYFGYNISGPTMCHGELQGLIQWFCVPTDSVAVGCSGDKRDQDGPGVFNLRFIYQNKTRHFLSYDRSGYEDCTAMTHVVRKFLADKYVCIAGERVQKQADGSELWTLERIKSKHLDGCRFRLPYELGCELPPFHVDENFPEGANFQYRRP